VFGLVAVLAERDERAEPVRLGALPMVNAQTGPSPAPLAGEVVPDLRAQHPFTDVDWFRAARPTASDPNPIRVEVPRRSDLAHRIVLARGRPVTEVRVGKPIRPFVPIA
jgi:hypothetical protein